MKKYILYAVVLAFSFGSAVTAEQQQLVPFSQDDASLMEVGDLSSGAASYAQSWSEYLLSYGPWLKEKASFAATFGTQALTWLISGIYGMVKDGLIGEGSKAVSDLLIYSASALITTYFELGPLTGPVTIFFVKGLSKKAVAIARAKLATAAQPLTEAGAAKLESLYYDVFAAKLGLVNPK